MHFVLFLTHTKSMYCKGSRISFKILLLFLQVYRRQSLVLIFDWLALGGKRNVAVFVFDFGRAGRALKANQQALTADSLMNREAAAARTFCAYFSSGCYVFFSRIVGDAQSPCQSLKAQSSPPFKRGYIMQSRLFLVFSLQLHFPPETGSMKCGHFHTYFVFQK